MKEWVKKEEGVSFGETSEQQPTGYAAHGDHNGRCKPCVGESVLLVVAQVLAGKAQQQEGGTRQGTEREAQRHLAHDGSLCHSLSFTAKAGQKTALVGESGSGKSTLAKLLIHYYDPQKGSISIGGQKLCDMSLEALNSRISYVAQDQYLFNTSLLENIRLGRLNATDEEVVEAAKKAQCMEFLEKLPQGIHSMAGDAGKMLSGGQRQRISLARAILKDAPIVVLDEATAYADPENEEKMEAAIAELVKGKTLVVIAHKLPAIMNADQICVMDHGKLVATGRHQELIQSCPEYQKLWKAAQDSAEWKVHTAKEGK